MCLRPLRVNPCNTIYRGPQFRLDPQVRSSQYILAPAGRTVFPIVLCHLRDLPSTNTPDFFEIGLSAIDERGLWLGMLPALLQRLSECVCIILPGQRLGTAQNKAPNGLLGLRKDCLGEESNVECLVGDEWH